MPLPAALALPVVRACLWTAATSLTSAAMTLFVRLAATELHPFQISFLRCTFGALFMLPWLWHLGWHEMRKVNVRMYLFRAAIAFVSTLTWFYGASYLPMAESTALNFTTPLFATVGAALVLKETVRIRRWTATVLGFIGVLIIVRPGGHPIDVATIAMIVSAITACFSVLIIKALTRTESAQSIVLFTFLFLAPMTLVPALFVWQTPSWYVLGLAVSMGIVGSFGNYCTARAFTLADASAVLPIEYLRMPVVALVGFAAFGEAPDVYVWIGAAIIAGSAVYIAHREAKLAQQASRTRRS
ncbi:MAG: EamA/RhaT family transporter [Alphaproteobacteria bacterium]|nr:EamA/RhaT family transporter [Alphaproteobacteria bacterium]